MVGLFAYNPPLCLEAVRDAGKLDEIKIVSFDEEPASLQGIIDGTVVGTVVQNPYQYGYESVRVLNALANGDKSVIPENKIIHIPARKITKENVKEFWDELKKLTGDTEQKAPVETKGEKIEIPAGKESASPAKEKVSKSNE